MKTLYLLALLLLANFSFCQTHTDTLSLPSGKVFTLVEVLPEYPGGEEALMSLVRKNIKYPLHEMDNDIQGRVVVGFVINEDGSISDIAIKESVSPGIDAEAIRLVKLLSNFKPGTQQGKAVRVSYLLPISFKLSGPEPKKKKHKN